MMQKKVKEKFLALVKWKFDVNSLSGGQLFASMEYKRGQKLIWLVLLE